MPARPARDNNLLDAVEALPGEPFAGTVYRVIRDGRDPIQCSAVGGRWDDRTFDVLYTSSGADGAVSEMYYHLSRGLPVIPSKIVYRLYELRVTLNGCIRIASLDQLAALGLKTAIFGHLSYFERPQEYPRTQEIAEAAHFLGRDGMVVPSARSDYPNVVMFCEPAGPAAVEIVRNRNIIVWDEWRREPLGF